jgi:hypothetical protein
MTWRGSSTTQDRIFACLVYLIPLLEVLPFGLSLFSLFPPLGYLFFPLFLLLPIYNYSIGGLSIISFALFIGLYIGVVRNESIRHFLRFNTMQALLLAIIVYLISLLLSLLGLASALRPSGFSAPLSPMDILGNTLFLAVVVASLYSVVQCVRGLYAEKIPVVSDAAYAQTH